MMNESILLEKPYDFHCQEFLCFAYKPEGLIVHQSLDQSRPDFVSEFSSRSGLRSLRLMNRLDKDTSGIVVFCIDSGKNKEADEALARAQKRYICLTQASNLPSDFQKKSYLKESKHGMEVVRSGGKVAITEFKRLVQSKTGELWSALLITGRRHQIRVHCQELGIPILGDPVYGNFKEDLHRMYLHPSWEWNSFRQSQ